MKRISYFKLIFIEAINSVVMHPLKRMCSLKSKGECESARGEKTKGLDSYQLAIKMIKKNAGLKQGSSIC